MRRGLKALAARLAPLVGRAGLLGLAALATYELHKSMDAGKGHRKQIADDFDRLMGKMSDYRDALSITSEEERARAVEGLERQKQVLQKSIEIQEAYIRSIEAQVIAFAEMPWYQQIFNVSPTQTSLRFLDDAEAQLKTLRAEVGAVDTGLERVRTQALEPLPSAPGGGAGNAGGDVGLIDFPLVGSSGATSGVKDTRTAVEREVDAISQEYDRLSALRTADLLSAADYEKELAGHHRRLLGLYEQAGSSADQILTLNLANRLGGELDDASLRPAREWVARLLGEVETGAKKPFEALEPLKTRLKELRDGLKLETVGTDKFDEIKAKIDILTPAVDTLAAKVKEVDPALEASLTAAFGGLGLGDLEGTPREVGQDLAREVQEGILAADLTFMFGGVGMGDLEGTPREVGEKLAAELEQGFLEEGLKLAFGGVGLGDLEGTPREVGEQLAAEVQAGILAADLAFTFSGLGLGDLEGTPREIGEQIAKELQAGFLAADLTYSFGGLGFGSLEDNDRAEGAKLGQKAYEDDLTNVFGNIGGFGGLEDNAREVGVELADGLEKEFAEADLQRPVKQLERDLLAMGPRFGSSLAEGVLNGELEGALGSLVDEAGGAFASYAVSAIGGPLGALAGFGVNLGAGLLGGLFGDGGSKERDRRQAQNEARRGSSAPAINISATVNQTNSFTAGITDPQTRAALDAQTRQVVTTVLEQIGVPQLINQQKAALGSG